MPHMAGIMGLMAGHPAMMAHAGGGGGPGLNATYEELLQLEDVKVTAKDSALKQLRRCTWGTPEAAAIKEAGCSVCQEDWQAGDKLMCLPCAHTFHEDCVQQWLKNYSNKCPVCKEGI